VSLRTPLCDLLGIDVPIFSVGFGSGAPPELAAAVSNAGGCGVVGLSGMPPEWMRQTVARTRALTDRPFGGNVMWTAPLWAGTSVDAIQEIKPAAEIVRDLVRETEEALAAATP
jgi:enoyl-[acyl-carrier protein] reductase II